MTQYNSLNWKLSNLQLHKLKSAIETETEILLRLLSNIIDNSNDETSCKYRKSFANCLSTDTKLSKTQLSKIIQSGGFLGKLLGPLLKTGLPLIKKYN